MITRSFHGRKQERGVALLVALFALLLLSAIGMGMMFSANTETNINMNFREKQIATYAAMAGAQEAKDRLSSIGDISTPSGVPSTSAANIIYIINPQSSETVAPWNYNNKYYDTELCHENVLGLTGTNGTQCPAAATSFPSGSAWYSTLDNSAGSYTGAYKVNPPLNYKWIRVQIKTNNSTPYPVDGSSSSSTQVCWNGTRQIPLPSGYKADCTPNGTVTKITVVNQGSSYNAQPQVQIAAPPTGGTQATAHATVANPSGVITGLALDTGGSGYTYVPQVVINGVGGAGSGATGTATISAAGSGGAIASLTRNDYGNPGIGCYTSNSTQNLTFTVPSGGAGTGAAGTATMTASYNCIRSISFNAGDCTNRLGDYIRVTVNGGNNNFAATSTQVIPNNGHLNNLVFSISNPGSAYTGVPAASDIVFHGITSGGVDEGTVSCSGVTVSAQLGYTLASVQLTSGGSGYTMAPAVSMQNPAAGQMPSITAVPNAISPGQVTGVTLTSAGSGYTNGATVTLVGGCGTPLVPVTCTTTATAHAVFPGIITGIVIDNGGAGYTAAPTVTLVGGGGTGATAQAYIQGGTYYSPVYLLTALGFSPAGARSMVQMEAAPAIRALSLPGALTLAGPQPTFGAPNSNNFQINGTDHPNGYIDPTSGATSPAPAGCDTTPAQSRPAIGVYDDPNAPTSPSSEVGVLDAIPAGRTTNYPGLAASPDVENVFGALGDQGTSPSGMNSIVSSISALPGANLYGGGQTDSTIALGTTASPVIDVINGDLTLSGSTQGYGILVVTGALTFRGNFTWNGIVLIIGDGAVYFSGGGGGTINGSVLVAKTKDPSTGATLSSLGQPVLDWSGGGGNGIYYDHCWADSMLSMIPMTVPVSSKPLTVLSVKTLSY